MKRNKSVTWHRTDPDSIDYSGLRIAIVGGTGGIGRAFSRFFASRGAHVVAVGQTFRDPGIPEIEFLKADLSLTGEAKRVGAVLHAETLDLVLLTAGIFAARTREVTAEGIERDMAISYLSRYVIVREIAPRLGAKRPAANGRPRVFVMGYPGMGQTGTIDDLNAERSYRAGAVHMNTVAANEALVLYAAARYPNAAYFGLNPGLIKTNIRSNFMGSNSLQFRFTEWMIGVTNPSAEDYAKQLAPLLVSPDIEEHSGAMFGRKGTAILPTPKLTDTAYIRAFIAASEALVSLAHAHA